MRFATSMGIFVAGMCLGWAATPSAQAGTLETVRARGVLTCGVGVRSIGFATRDGAGRWSGFDVDFCRAMAAAVLGDADKARIVPLSAARRIEALTKGEVDVLWRNTTMNFARDTDPGIVFPVIQYYDGQGFLVRRSLKVDSVRRFGGVRLCVQAGTTSQRNAARYLESRKIDYVPVLVPDDLTEALVAGRCDAITSDTWDLAGVRSEIPNPEAFVILPELISKEPLGPVVRRGDEAWFLVTRWLVYALIAAEELGITQANAGAARTQPHDGAARHLLGQEDDVGKPLGLEREWASRAVRAVGNYGEIFERNLGPKSVLRLNRGLNRPWTQGGLIYAPPIP